MAAKRLIRPTCCGVSLLLPDGGENALSGLRVAGAAFVAGWRRKRLIRPMCCGCCFCCRMAAQGLIRPTCCGVSLLLPDGGETPYPAYVLRGAAFVAGWRRNALSGLHVAGCRFCCRMAAKRLIRPDGPAFVGLISAAPSGNSQNPACERINASARRSALHAYLPASLSPRAGYRRRGYRSSYSYDRR